MEKIRLPLFFQAEDGIRDTSVTGVQTCALPIYCRRESTRRREDTKIGPMKPHTAAAERRQARCSRSCASASIRRSASVRFVSSRLRVQSGCRRIGEISCQFRSEEHTSELQSPMY